jgi:hypothetical protein
MYYREGCLLSTFLLSVSRMFLRTTVTAGALQPRATLRGFAQPPPTARIRRCTSAAREATKGNTARIRPTPFHGATTGSRREPEAHSTGNNAFKTNPTATNRHKSRIGSECPVAGSNVLPVVDSECPVAGSNVPVIDSTSGAHPEVIRREGSASRFIRRKRLTGVSSPFKVPGTAPRVAHPP